MLLVKTYIALSRIHGFGLFAAEPIQEGEVIWRFREGFDSLLSVEYVDTLPEIAQAHIVKHCGLLRNGFFLHTGDDDRFINHSASPNTVPRPYLDDLCAAREIAKGEEITEDYRAFDLNAENEPYINSIAELSESGQSNV